MAPPFPLQHPCSRPPPPLHGQSYATTVDGCHRLRPQALLRSHPTGTSQTLVGIPAITNGDAISGGPEVELLMHVLAAAVLQRGSLRHLLRRCLPRLLPRRPDQDRPSRMTSGPSPPLPLAPMISSSSPPSSPMTVVHASQVSHNISRDMVSRASPSSLTASRSSTVSSRSARSPNLQAEVQVGTIARPPSRGPSWHDCPTSKPRSKLSRLPDLQAEVQGGTVARPPSQGPSQPPDLQVGFHSWPPQADVCSSASSARVRALFSLHFSKKAGLSTLGLMSLSNDRLSSAPPSSVDNSLDLRPSLPRLPISFSDASNRSTMPTAP